MSAGRLSIELHNRGIKIKEWLKHANYNNDADVIDDFLCHYDYKNIYDKQELLTSILCTFNTRRCSELFISDIATECIKDFCNLIEKMKIKLDEEISTLSFDRFIYNDRESDLKIRNEDMRILDVDRCSNFIELKN